VLEVGAPPSIDGTPAGGAAFGAAAFFGPPPPDGRLPADRPGAFEGFLAVALLAGFFEAFFFAGFFAFAAFFGAAFFFAAFFAPFLAAMILPSCCEVIYMTYMVTYVRCQTKK
jgi:hypothetical protein